MKRWPMYLAVCAFSSPPARGRGLKLRLHPDNLYGPGVAPCAGAWIETRSSLSAYSPSYVAPCAGAWIET